ncbi:unnamed protein product [Echinostoma caproni]|uniref:Nucleolin-like n=1 Tax=Echinostoma caproni TaxID=27848 RepID=A0A183AGN7_9TREM|nr:unnamed protein product [Echinostoma caproni]
MRAHMSSGRYVDYSERKKHSLSLTSFIHTAPHCHALMDASLGLRANGKSVNCSASTRGKALTDEEAGKEGEDEMDPKEMAELIRKTEEQFFETIERKRKEREMKEAAAAEAAKAAAETADVELEDEEEDQASVEEEEKEGEEMNGEAEMGEEEDPSAAE